ncbi:MULTISPECIES: nuclear transport factor 2 family protein [unclassified Streptomyces]|uniref:nuclear transport factor 2 family protein n=1 Tax=unclassified Streptomyces TaxID=2593676 RepID=UPI0006FDD12F|nr:MULTISPECIES: nuclear transport factor 2 family protein [unclassified Streptomyces]KQX56321.1 hydroxylacyl-CoA dehydrogenase [Streptomyces sp. Root1304]KRA97136.1 hydroxylacyl-CoA dehydrogenase [Streptomyces sp. Root66D1]
MSETVSTAYASLCADIQRFHARQMRLLDSGDAEGWAATFTEDGLFAPPSLPEPVRGRAALAAGVRAAHKELAAAGEVRRHVLTTAEVDEPDADGAVRVRSYVQVVATLRDQAPRLLLMCVCEDVLVVEDGAWRVRERYVTRDDRP